MIASAISGRLFHTRLGFSKPNLSNVIKNSIATGASTVVLTMVIMGNKEGPTVEEPDT